MTENIVIQLKKVIKEYTIHHEKPTLVEKFINGRKERFSALKNITLTVRRGEKIGIIGSNGSGKTTLLKIIAGIASPTSGSVITRGKIVSLIDMESGFHPDLSGYQNIYLNGLVLGLTKREIDSRIKNIIDYAEVGRFIDAPIFTYSEGMKMRLGFSIAAHSKPDILLLDEHVSVADYYFQKKTENQILHMSQNSTIIFSSHYKVDIDKYCKRILTMDKGRIVEDADIAHCTRYYQYLI